MKAAVLLAPLLGLVVCDGGQATHDQPASMAIQRSLESRLGRGGGSARARDLLPGAWDLVEVAGPYATVASIEAKTGPDPRINDSGISARDDITLLILLSGSSIISVVELPRRMVDFSPLAGSSLTPDDCLTLVPGEPPRVERGSGC